MVNGGFLFNAEMPLYIDIYNLKRRKQKEKYLWVDDKIYK